MFPRKAEEGNTQRLNLSQEVYSPSLTGFSEHFQNYPGFPDTSSCAEHYRACKEWRDQVLGSYLIFLHLIIDGMPEWHGQLEALLPVQIIFNRLQRFLFPQLCYKIGKECTHFRKDVLMNKSALLTCPVLHSLWMCKELRIAPQPYPSSLEYHPDYWLSSPSAGTLNH